MFESGEDSVFPDVVRSWPASGDDPAEQNLAGGLTKYELFAALAMHALVSRGGVGGGDRQAVIAASACQVAHALCVELYPDIRPKAPATEPEKP